MLKVVSNKLGNLNGDGDRTAGIARGVAWEGGIF